MNTIYITIENLIAKAPETAVIVSDNTGYQIEFDFDDAWDGYPLKTAVFVWYRDSLPYCQSIPFSGDTVQVPRLPAVGHLYVGVTAGNLQTTTPARIACDRSILSSGGSEPEAPTESEYAQIMALIHSTVGASAYELAVSHGYTDSEEAWLASLKGEQGPQGPQGPRGEQGPAGANGNPGADGRTPVKGTDYWTQQDKAEIQEECNTLLNAELANRTQTMPEFVSDIGQCTDPSKLYVLPDGYLYAHYLATSQLGDDTNFADRGSPDWLNDQRMSMESSIWPCVGAVVTNYIPVKPGDVVRVYNLDMVSHPTNYDNTPQSGIYDAGMNALFVNVARNGDVFWSYVVESEHTAALTVTSPDGAYFRFCGEPYDGFTAEDIVITINEKEVSTHYQWANTGVAFMAAVSEGTETEEIGENAHAEGYQTKAIGMNAHAEGYQTKAMGMNAHAEGSEAIASGANAHAEGDKTTAEGYASHAEGKQSSAYGYGSHAEGYKSSTGEDAQYAHAEGYETEASEQAAHAEGYQSKAYGTASHAEGWSTTASGFASHTEGEATVADNDYTHAEGMGTTASGSYSHSEGDSTTASGEASHAEGQSTVASGDCSHAEGGDGTTASGYYSHAEGCYTKAIGDASHAEGEGTVAKGDRQHVQGMWNIEDHNNRYAHIIGNGVDDERSNAHTVDWDGNAWYAGTVEAAGIILQSPDGKRFLVTVNNAGALCTTPLT